MNTAAVDTPDQPTPLRPTELSADDVISLLTGVLDQATRALADAGRPVQASRFAAQAWSSLRTAHPEHAERLNRAMHYLARQEAALEARAPQLSIHHQGEIHVHHQPDP